jgi:hypothetical protein
LMFIDSFVLKLVIKQHCYYLDCMALMIRWSWMWSSWQNEKLYGTLKYLEKTCPIGTFSARNPAWPDLALNWCHHSGKPAYNCMLTHWVVISVCNVWMLR